MRAVKPVLSKKAGIEQVGLFALSTRQRPQDWCFLDLPGEVQNEIYSAILAETGAFLTRDLRIAMPTSLSLVSKQIHTNLLSQAMYSVTARVVDFDFTKIITFLNRLPQDDIDLLRTKATLSEPERKPRLQIELLLTGRFYRGGGDAEKHLLRWLKRFEIPTKRAAELEIEYVWTQSHEINWLKHFNQAHEEYILTIPHEMGKAMHKILDSVLKTWRQEHQKLAERLGSPEFNCNCQAPVRGATWRHHYGPCGHCVLSQKLQDTKPPEKAKKQIED